MNEFEIGPSTLSPVYKNGAGEVDEEPPGSKSQNGASQHPSLIQQRLWPQFVGGSGLPEPLRLARSLVGPEPVPSAIAARPSRTSPRARAFRKAFYRDVTDKQWNDWRWQARSRIRTRQQIEKMLILSAEELEGLDKAGAILPVATTPYYMSLIAADDANQGLRRTIIPTAKEFTQVRGESADPLGEDHDMQRRAWCIVTRTACCSWPWTFARPTAAIAPVRGWSDRASSWPTRPV